MARPKIQLTKKSGFVLFVILILVAIAGWSSYSYLQTKQELAKLSTAEGQQRLAQQEVDMVINQLKKRMILPDKERPTLATVTDVEVLKKNQPFFQKAQNGDKVLVYVGDKKAIIYRPSKDLIVNVGFIAVSGDDSQLSGTTQQSKMTIEVRNGTQTSGLGQKVADAMKTLYTVQSITDAKKKDYAKTLVIDLGKLKNKDELTKLVQVLDAELVTTLPDGESSSKSDAIVLVGSDKSSE
jgi:type II secretory pathway pseudopilin PulG